MSNPEWRPFREEEYPRYCYSAWDENRHLHHIFEDDEYDYEEDFLSIHEEMLADSIVRDVSLTDNAVRLSVSTPPRLTIAEDVSMTFNYSDKATITQEVTDGQLSLTVQENDALQSIKICVNNRTWVIPLDTFPISPPLVPKKR